MRQLIWCIPAFAFVLIILPANNLQSENTATMARNTRLSNMPELPLGVDSPVDINAPYGCNLKVYMVEIESRYKDNTNYYHYDFGFLDFALDTMLNLGYQETFQQTKTWDARAAGFASDKDSIYVTPENMMAIAVLFNNEVAGVNYSDPVYYFDSLGAPFDIHNVDACAAATDGNPGYDTAYGSTTHTVFVEDATAFE